jgi:malonate decarboxylase beta subunit
MMIPFSCKTIRFFNATARRRVAAFLDEKSFEEWLPPAERVTSPHLKQMGLPVAFDDGVIIGRGRLEGREIFLAAQEGAFLGGSIGEVHGAKITGVLRRAVERRPAGVVLLLDSGGVRLQEANAGEIAVSEIIRMLLECRRVGVQTIALVGGANGAFGGAGIIAGCCDLIIASEQTRLGVSGPEVIESVMGVEEFDSRDRALVWRTVGGKNRYLSGQAHVLVEDRAEAWRHAVVATLDRSQSQWSTELLEREQAALEKHVTDYGECKDGAEVWRKMGFAHPDEIPMMDVDSLTAEAQRLGVRS